MKIIHHASGSSGNAIQVDRTLIDAGVKVDGEFDLLLITHAHIDHIRHITDLIQRSRHFYTPQAVLWSIYEKTLKWSKKRKNILYREIADKLLDDGEVEYFELKHDIPCVGYVIGDYVHITDTGVFDISRVPKGKKFYTIESNYDDVELDLSGRPLELIDRIRQTHMSNEQAIQLAYDLEANEVMFVHLSDETNSESLAKVTHNLLAPQIIKHYPKGENIYVR